MNAPINFAFHEKQMRVVMIDADPWWVAADLCAILDLRNVTMALKKLDDDMVTLNRIEGASNGLPVNLVNEPGMWMLVLRSDKAEAADLRRWLSREVLPALRKHGTYTLPGFEPPPVVPMDLDPGRLTAGVAVVREARRLFGLCAARDMWLQVGLPPVRGEHGGGEGLDPFVEALAAFVANRAETTIQRCADGMGLTVVDGSTRHRIGQLLREWGWTGKTEKVRGKPTWVFRRPQPVVEAEAREMPA